MITSRRGPPFYVLTVVCGASLMSCERPEQPLSPVPSLANYSRVEARQSLSGSYTINYANYRDYVVEFHGAVQDICRNGVEWKRFEFGDSEYMVRVDVNNNCLGAWDGIHRAIKLGTCSVLGMHGTVWKYPRLPSPPPTGGNPDHYACISDDGLVLSKGLDQLDGDQITGVRRRDVPASMFELPADAREITMDELERMIRWEEFPKR